MALIHESTSRKYLAARRQRMHGLCTSGNLATGRDKSGRSLLDQIRLIDLVEFDVMDELPCRRQVGELVLKVLQKHCRVTGADPSEGVCVPRGGRTDSSALEEL